MNGIQQWGGYGGQSLVPQGFFGGLIGAPLGGLIGKGIGGLFGNAGLGSQIGHVAGGIGGGLLPFQIDPAQQLQQAYAQPLQQQTWQQLAPQGFFGNLLGHIGQPLGSAIGGIFGQSGLGGSIGSAAGQLGRLLPFQMDPMQQLQQAYAQQLYQQQMQQLAPQGIFGNLIGQIGQPVGNAIGSLFGQPGVGSAIGGAVGQLARLLPFQIDPIQQAMLQQAMLQQAMLQQLAQQQQPTYQSSGQQAYSTGQPTLH